MDLPPVPEVRRATAADGPSIQRIYAACLARAAWFAQASTPAPDFGRDSVGETVDVAVGPDGSVQGLVAVDVAAAFIHHLYVDPPVQRRNIGTRLLVSLDAWLPRPWRLKCVTANRDALRFYARHGAVATGTGTGEHGDYTTLEFSGRAARTT